jgi:hypothetical protein
MGKIKDFMLGKKDPAKEAERQRLERIFESNRKQARYEGRLQEEIRLGKAEGRAAARGKGKGGVVGFLNDLGTAVNQFEQSPIGRSIADPTALDIGDPFMLGFDAPQQRNSNRSKNSSRFVVLDTKTGRVVKKPPRKKKKKKKQPKRNSSFDMPFW